MAPRAVAATDHDHLSWVREVFLPLARHRGVVPFQTIDSLEEYAWSLEPKAPAYAGAPATGTQTAPAEPAAAAPARTAPAPTDGGRPAPTMPPGWGLPPSMRTTTPAGRPWDTPLPTRAPAPAARTTPPPAVPAVPVVPAAPREPGRLATWWSRTRGDIGADLAAHGLAYLGVLLLFVGAFGLVAFSFGDVAEGMRPVAEIGIAITPFLASWMLLRRGAEIAGRALELAGGLLLPVMLLTSFLDGVPVPPDLVGVPLVIASTAVAVVVAGAYWLWSRAHAASMLRFLVAPVLWLAVGLATMGVGRAIPSGAGVATVTAVQVCCMTLAVVASLAWARTGLDRPLQRATRTAARVGVVVLAPLALLTWASGGWPIVPVLVTGLAGLVVLGWLDLGVAPVLQPVWWAVTGLAVLPSLEDQAQLAWLGVLAGAVYLVLLELSARAHRRLAAALDAAGVAVAVALTVADARVALGAMVALALWAGVRRLRPWPGTAATTALDLVAGAAPVAAVVALGAATSDAALAALVGAALVLASLVVLDVPAVHTALRRDGSDRFWLLWWDAGMVIATVAVAAVTGLSVPVGPGEAWLPALALVLLAVSALLGPLGRSGRPWAAIALLTWAWLLAATTLAWSAPLVSGAVAVAGLALVVAGTLVPASARVTRHASPAAAVLVGHVLAPLSIVVAAVVGAGTGPWLSTALLATGTAGLLVTVVADERSRSPLLTASLAEFEEVARHAVHALLALMLVITSASLVDSLDLLGSEWTGVTVSVVAFALAAVTRLPVSLALSRSATWSALAAAVLALTMLSGLSPMLVGLGVVAVMPLVLAPRARVRAPVWMAWSALAPILGILLSQALPAYDALDPIASAAIALAVMGGSLLLVALGLDLRGRPWTLQPVPTGRGLVVPAAVGLLEVVASVGVARALPWGDDVAAGVVLAAAFVALAAAVLTRVWSALAVGAALVWFGVWELASGSLVSMPWVGLLATVALLGAAEASRRLPTEGRAWARGDLPLLAVAHLTALTSLLTMGTGTSAALVLLAVGVVCIALAVRLRAVVWAASAYGVLGAVLVVTAGAVAGPGWLALALAAVSVGSSVVATRITGAVRLVLVLVGALTAFAAWLSFAVWLDLAPADRAAWTGMIAGVAAVATAALVRWTSLDRPAQLVRGGLAMVVLTAAPLAGGSAYDETLYAVDVWTALALALGAVAAGLAAARLHVSLRYVAVLYGVASVLELLDVLDATTAAMVATFEAATLVVMAALLLRVVRERLGAWLTPVVVVGVTASALAVVTSVADLPDTRLLSSALAVAALYLLTTGTVLRAFGAVLISPVVLCAAWITWAAQALSPNPQWYTVALGLTVLVVSELVRRRAGTALRPVLAWVDGVGVALMVGASFVQAFTESLGYALLAVVLGVLVAGWGALTRVRRRLTMGGLVVVLAAAVLVLVPLAQLLPGWSDAVMWVLVACVGLLALVGATLLERGRAVVRRGMDELTRLTQGWE